MASSSGRVLNAKPGMEACSKCRHGGLRVYALEFRAYGSELCFRVSVMSFGEVSEHKQLLKLKGISNPKGPRA